MRRMIGTLIALALILPFSTAFASHAPTFEPTMGEAGGWIDTLKLDFCERKPQHQRCHPAPDPSPSPVPSPVPSPIPTPEPTPAPLVISNVDAGSITDTSATISWTVDRPATGQVEFGTTTAYGSLSSLESSFDYTAHEQELTGLTPGTVYHFRVHSEDAGGVAAVSADFTFTTTGGVTACTTTVPGGAAIEPVIDAAPPGSTICLSQDATYVLSGPLFIDQKSGITLDGQDATLTTNLAPGNVWAVQEVVYVRGGSDLTIRDLNIVGSHHDPGNYYGDGREFQAGIALLGVQTALIEDVVVSNNMGDGFGIYGYAGEPSRDITILNSQSHGNGRMGVAVVNADGVLVEGGLWSDQAWVVFEVEPDPNGTDSVHNVTFRNATVYGSGRHLFAVSMIGGNSNITCEGMHVLAGPNYGIWSFVEPKNGERNTNIVFRNNVGEQPFAENPGWEAVLLMKDTDGVTVTGNTQPVTSSSMVGVLNDGSTGLTVSGNSFPGAGAVVGTP